MLKDLVADLRASVAPSLIALLLPTNAMAQGTPVETGSHAPVALWFVGVFILGVAIIYGIMRNRRRSRVEKQLTEQATEDNYRREDRNQRF